MLAPSSVKNFTNYKCFNWPGPTVPGEPENGVRDVGGVVALPGCPPKNPPGEAIEGGEAGEDGPPLEVFGGLMRFSFCRLLKKLMKNKKATLIAI